jgi:3D (Asp-Asp-Asp) domain-containing protein
MLNKMNQEKEISKNIISLKLAKKIVFSLVFVLIFDFVLFPAPVMASEYNELQENQGFEEILGENKGNLEENVEIKNSFPENTNIKISWTGNYTMTAYNSEAVQCDASPCITANGFNVCEHGVEDTIAANFLPFGAKVRIPDLFGEKVFIVRDRMNSRYDTRIDVWMLERQDAIQFGVKYAKIEVLAPLEP